MMFLLHSQSMAKELPSLIAVVGPTATGKTALAVLIARAVDGEVVSADSRQVYRGLNLLSGKATKREMRGVRHHLLDVASPRGVFTVEKFEKRAGRAIRDIQRRGKVPILCGGAGQYVDAIAFEPQHPAVSPNPKLRRTLTSFSVAEMFARLKKLDPVRAAAIDSKNRPRLERAIEIATALGKVPPLSPAVPRFRTLWVGVTAPRNTLAARIEKRLDARLRAGMVTEAKKLRAAGLPWRRFDSLGLECRWLGRYLQKKITRAEMRSGLLSNIKKYAKRQMTWFKRDPQIVWHRPSKARPAIALAKKFLR